MSNHPDRGCMGKRQSSPRHARSPKYAVQAIVGLILALALAAASAIAAPTGIAEGDDAGVVELELAGESRAYQGDDEPRPADDSTSDDDFGNADGTASPERSDDAQSDATSTTLAAPRRLSARIPARLPAQARDGDWTVWRLIRSR